MSEKTTTLEKEKIVGLQIFTNLLDKGKVAILQRRGTYDFEKMKDETWPGGFQITAIGRATDPKEFFLNVLYDEVKGELGQYIADIVIAEKNKLGDQKLFDGIVVRGDTEKEVKIYGFGLRWPEVKKHFKLHVSTGGLGYVAEANVSKIKNLLDFDKEKGVPDLRTIAMFPEEKEAVEKGLQIIDIP